MEATRHTIEYREPTPHPRPLVLGWPGTARRASDGTWLIHAPGANRRSSVLIRALSCGTVVDCDGVDPETAQAEVVRILGRTPAFGAVSAATFARAHRDACRTRPAVAAFTESLPPSRGLFYLAPDASAGYAIRDGDGGPGRLSCLFTLRKHIGDGRRLAGHAARVARATSGAVGECLGVYLLDLHQCNGWDVTGSAPWDPETATPIDVEIIESLCGPFPTVFYLAVGRG